jgi:hypothetical protein
VVLVKRVFIAISVFLVILIALGLFGCSKPKSELNSPQNVTANPTEAKVPEIPTSFEWNGRKYFKSEKSLKTEEANAKHVGQYNGLDIYERSVTGYTEKLLKDTSGNFIVYEPEVLFKKPNIYLYPKEHRILKIKVEPRGYITRSIPNYNGQWQVAVDPQSKIDNQYDFLFYEAMIHYPFALNEGWIADRERFPSTMNLVLTEIGLNAKEKEDFLQYWLKELKWEKDYYRVYYLDSNEVSKAIKLDVTPEPDSLLRAFFVFVPDDNPSTLKEPNITPFVRKGFTVVEWGGFGE